MALNAKINKEVHEALSDELKAEYKEQDGSFVLDVVKVDGLALENVDGLKSTVEKLRTNERALQATVKTTEKALEQTTEKFKGIDPVAAKAALDKIGEIKDWDGETKVKEAVGVAEGKMQVKMDELVKNHNTTMDGLNTELKSSQSQLQDAIVISKIIEAIHTENGNVQLLMPHVRTHVNMVKDNSGQWKPEVINDNGDPRIGDSSGTPMTISQYVEEMKTQETFAAAFPGANSTGTGSNGDNSESGKHKQNNSKVKIIAASDEEGKSGSLEDIASGKATVDMSK